MKHRKNEKQMQAVSSCCCVQSHLQIFSLFQQTYERQEIKTCRKKPQFNSKQAFKSNKKKKKKRKIKLKEEKSQENTPFAQ